MNRLKNGFGQVSNDVMKNPELTIRDKGLYAYLCCHADSKTNQLIVSVDRIASECNMTRATVKRILVILEYHDIIFREKRGMGLTSITTILK